CQYPSIPILSTTAYLLFLEYRKNINANGTNKNKFNLLIASRKTNSVALLKEIKYSVIPKLNIINKIRVGCKNPFKNFTINLFKIFQEYLLRLISSLLFQTI